MFYNYGKNYFMSLDNSNIQYYTTNNILEFLRGYIELNSKIILPNNITNYSKNLDKIYNKYPLLLLYIRKKEDIDNILLDRILKLLSKALDEKKSNTALDIVVLDINLSYGAEVRAI